METKEEKYILDQMNKYEKMEREYNEVGRNQLKKKYEELKYLMYDIYTLIKDGYKYRKLREDNEK